MTREQAESDPDIKKLIQASVLATSEANARAAENIANELAAKGSDLSGADALRFFANALRTTPRNVDVVVRGSQQWQQ